MKGPGAQNQGSQKFVEMFEFIGKQGLIHIYLNFNQFRSTMLGKLFKRFQ